MKSVFSLSWIKSKQPRKQRKYQANASLHTRRKFLGCNLSKELRTQHNMRTIPLKKGDKIKIMRGQFKGQEGNIDRVDIKRTKVYVNVAQITKKDGSKVYYPQNPSNLMIMALNLDDPKRIKNPKVKKKEGDNDGKKSQ